MSAFCWCQKFLKTSGYSLIRTILITCLTSDCIHFMEIVAAQRETPGNIVIMKNMA
jgi:hypothetical protein